MKAYQKEDIKVVWNQELCQHAGECVKGSPKVFNPNERPWIKTGGASKDEIIATVAKCPSGALSIKKDEA